ncbi:MAG: trypsin-like serine protease [Planctomycetota bacterium]
MTAPTALLALPAAFLLAFALPTTAPSAIVVRHDRDDAVHRDLARRHPAVCDVGGVGVGVLVAPNWVLTAGHVARSVSPFRHTVGFAALARHPEGREVPVDLVVVHPDFADGPDGIEHDLALLRLARPVRGVEPVGLHRGDDELGLEVTLVGFGATGTGLTGVAREDRTWRAATNRVDEVRGDRLVFRFDRGEAATDLEGTWAGNDSGGPCLALVDGRLETIGVGVVRHGGRRPRRRTLASYGDLDVSFRVSTHAAWIVGTMERCADAAPAIASEPVAGAPPSDTRDARWRHVLAYLDARRGSDADRARFVATHAPRFAEEGADTRDLWWPRMLPPDLPDLRVDAHAATGDERHVLLVTPVVTEAIALRFDFDDGPSHFVTGVELGLVIEADPPAGGPDPLDPAVFDAPAAREK